MEKLFEKRDGMFKFVNTFSHTMWFSKSTKVPLTHKIQIYHQITKVAPDFG